MKLHSFLGLFLLFLCIACFSAGCGRRVPFAEREEAERYLEEEYPDRAITLSEKYRESWGLIQDRRWWSFTMEGYPEDTFHVYSMVGWGMLPIKMYRSMATDVGTVVRERLIGDFEKNQLPAFDKKTRRLWKGLHGYEVILRIDSVAELETALQLIAASEETLAEEERKLEFSSYYTISMQIERKAPDLGATLLGTVDCIDYEELPFGRSRVSFSAEYRTGDDPEETAQRFRDSVLLYYMITADSGNGIDEAAKQSWCEVQRRKQQDMEEEYRGWRYVWLEQGKQTDLMAMEVMTEDGGDEQLPGIYLSYPEARELFLRQGLRVKGGADRFTVTGVTGDVYQFDSSYYHKSNGRDYKKNGEDRLFAKTNNGLTIWAVDDETIEEVSGVRLRELLR